MPHSRPSSFIEEYPNRLHIPQPISPRTVATGLPGRASPRLTAINSPKLPQVFTPTETEEWMRGLSFQAKDLLKEKILADINSEATVEKACEVMLEKAVTCLAVYEQRQGGKKNYVGLFDYADLNAFLLLAVHSRGGKPNMDDEKVKEIIAKAKQGGDASVGLACDLSQKNPLVTLPPTATLISLLKVFARGTHRVLITDEESDTVHGLVEDHELVLWLTEHAQEQPSVRAILSTPLSDLTILPYLSNPRPVISSSSDDTILDAMDKLSTEGVSSVAVVDVLTGNLLSAVSVTDIGKVIAPSQDKNIIYTPLHQLIARIKEPYGSTDGEERYPIFSVQANNTLDYTIQKLLATNSHRVFIAEDHAMSPSVALSGNLRGVVSMVDVLSVFALLANIPDVDPSQMSRHRRANSTTSSSSGSSRSRTNSSLLTGLAAPIPSSPRRIPLEASFGHGRRGSSTFDGAAGGLNLSPVMPSLLTSKPRSPSISKPDPKR